MVTVERRGVAGFIGDPAHWWQDAIGGQAGGRSWSGADAPERKSIRTITKGI